MSVVGATFLFDNSSATRTIDPSRTLTLGLEPQPEPEPEEADVVLAIQVRGGTNGVGVHQRRADMSEGWTAWCAVTALVVLALLLPARYDPAIRWREWLDRDESGRR